MPVSGQSSVRLIPHFGTHQCQTHPPLWHTPVSGQSLVRLTLCTWHTPVSGQSSVTHPLFLAHTSVRSVFSHSPSTLADTSVRSVFSQTHPPLWHTLVFSQTHPVLGRYQCQVSLQSTHPPLWQTPVSGQPSARLTLISEACWLHTASSLADVTVCAVFRRVMACCILVLSSIIFFWGVQSAEHHVSQSIHQGGAAQMIQAVDSETKNTNSPAGHKREGRKELVFNAQSTMIVISG